MEHERARGERVDLTRYATDFYQEVARIRRTIKQASARKVAVDPGSDSPSVDPEAFIQRLQAMLERQSVEVARTGIDFLIADYREVQYVLAALADDIFLHDVSWEGRDAWNENILEYRLFRSRFAGTRVFDTIGSIVRSGDGRRAAVAEVYLMALHLGFRGRYRENPDETPRREYMRQLFIFINGRPPELEEPDRLLVPEAYAHTAAERSDRKLGLSLDWPWVGLGLITAASAASVVVWLAVTASLDSAVVAAFDAARGTGR